MQDFNYISENGTLMSDSLTDAGYLYAFSDSDYNGWSICTAGKTSDILGSVKTATLFTGISLLTLTFCALALGILLNRKKALEARAALVPKMLLQPLIENALKHGKLNLYPDGNVTINASFTDDRCLCIEVTNNGKLIEPEKCDELNLLFNNKKAITSNTDHIGLATTCIRWMIMFGEGAAFSIARTENTTSVTMKGISSRTL